MFIHYTKKLMACSLMMMHMLSDAMIDGAMGKIYQSQQSSSSVSPAALVTAGLAVTGLVAVTGYRYATASQDTKVIANIDNTVKDLCIPKINMAAVRQAAQENKYNEKNVSDFFKKLRSVYHDGTTQSDLLTYSSNDIEYFGTLQPLEWISEDRKAVKSTLNYDLWFRSWFNPQVSKKRKEVQAYNQKINDAQAFAQEQKQFLGGFQAVLKCDKLDIEILRSSSDNVNESDIVKAIQGHSSSNSFDPYKVVSYSTNISDAGKEIGTYTHTPYAALQKLCIAREQNMTNSFNKLGILQSYCRQLRDKNTDFFRKSFEEQNKIQKEFLQILKNFTSLYSFLFSSK